MQLILFRLGQWVHFLQGLNTLNALREKLTCKHAMQLDL